MELSYITHLVIPLTGGIIGYITNDIAIRMLFRPHQAKYLFGFKVPFTPGLIPKEKARIADAIGNAISENLMSKEVLKKYLLSDEMVDKVRSTVEGFIMIQKSNQETVRTFLLHYLSEKEINAIIKNVNQNLSIQISKSLSNPLVGEKVAHVAMEHIAQKLTFNGAQELLASIGGALKGVGGVAASLLGSNIVGKFLEMLREPTEHFLAKQINKMLQENSDTIVSNMVEQEMNTFLDKQVCKQLEGHDEQLVQVVNTVEGLYRTVIKEHLPRILESVNISKIIRERINEMNVNETEKLIFQVMDKELKAIVWLGALLGLVMGCINLFI